jgi:hypothetical protein
MPNSNARRVGAFGKLLANYAADDAVMDAGEAAELLFVRGIAFCSDSDSDGYMTEAQVIRYVGAGMRDAKKRAERLVEVGLWTKVEGGYVARSHTKIHPTAEEKGYRLKADRERKRAAPSSESCRNPAGILPESERSGGGFPNHPAPDSLSMTDQNSSVQVIAQRTDTAARRDELFEAVAEACGITVAELTKTSRGPMNNAVSQLRSVGATPGQVKVRANRYRQRYPDTALTPTALVKHWPSLAEQNPSGQGVSGGW